MNARKRSFEEMVASNQRAAASRLSGRIVNSGEIRIIDLVESGYSDAIFRIVPHTLPWPARCHSDIGASISESTESRMPHTMFARVFASCGIRPPQSLEPKPGRSTATVRQPS